MGEAAPQDGGDMTDDGEQLLATVNQALEALRHTWGHVFMFGYDNGQYWAVLHHRLGSGVLRAETPEELGRLCADKFKASPS